ncbi:MAG: guanylate kinase [Armatimonadetes bacterium]|nr:guanylate kinase [Armatimonadota bacterium]
MNEIERFRRREGLAVVVSGPSGVGKDTLLDRFLADFAGVTRLITCTTRPKRETETDGIDYFFVTQKEFDRMRESQMLLESAEVYGYSYGSPKQYVDERRSEGLDVILKLDVQGGLSVKRALPEAVMVFVAPPSLEELERRLRKRRTESDDSLARRLGNARAELDLISRYDYLIIHHSPEQASAELGAIITAERVRVINGG